jgi:ABC-type phosphate/phosphonate transport system substrate-binding protein
MAGLTLVTYLGDNTTPTGVALAAALTDRLGTPVAFDPGASGAARLEAIDSGTADIVWMCGYATVDGIDSGRLLLDIVAAPVFPGHTAATYGSVIVARRELGARSLDDLAGARLAVNEWGSWSGYQALRIHLAETGRRDAFFGSVARTGSHRASLDALIAGEADTAAIDDTVWAYWTALDRRLETLDVVDRTRAWPAPPFSLSQALAPAVRDALTAALPRVVPDGLDAIRPAVSADYDPIRRGAALAAEVGW